MSETTKEALKTSEIKTPEELIKRLESKSQKTLADKVRTIEQTVTDSTESKWKKLQAELPESEKKEIETILKDENPEVGTRLKTIVDDSQEKMDKALKTGGIAAVLGVATAGVAHEAAKLKDKSGMGFIDGIVGFFENLSNKWDMLTKSISNWFASSFPSLAKMFGIEASTSSSQVKPDVKNEEDEKKKEEAKKEKESKNNNEVYVYAATVKALVGFFVPKDKVANKGMIQDVFSQKKFQELTFSQAKAHLMHSQKNPSYPLGEKIGIVGAENENITTALMLILNGKSGQMIEKKFKTNKNNAGKSIENATMHSLVYGIHQDVAHFGNMLNMSVDNLANIQEYVALNVKKGEGGEIEVSGPLKDKAVGEMGLTKELLLYMTLISGHKPLENTDTLLTKITSENNTLHESDIVQLKEKILPFAQNIQKEISTNKNVNLGVDFSSILTVQPLSMSEIIKLYIVTGGKVSFNEMNDFEKMSIYASMVGISGSRNENVKQGSYSAILGEELMSETSKLIPQGVKDIGSKIVTSASEMLWESAKSSVGWLAGVAKNSPIAAAVIIAYFIFGKWIPMRTSPYQIAKK